MNQAATKTLQPRLGDLLTEEQLIPKSVIDELVELQTQTGGKLGELLTTKGAIGPWQLYKTLARQTQRPLVDLYKHPCDDALLEYEQIDTYYKFGIIPWKKVENRLIVATVAIDEFTARAAGELFDQPVEFVLCTPRDLRHAIESRFGTLMEHDTRTRIIREMPDYSAHYTTNHQQQQIIGALFALITALFVLWPSAMLVLSLITINLFYFSTIMFKYILYFRRHNIHPSSQSAHEAAAALNDKDLPVYSILVPMYHETKSVPRILSAIRALDYPKHKLDVKLVIEEDDDETLNAIKEARPESFFDIIRVPYSQPRTKPRACSYALNFVKGDLVTIYDAEDRPEPMQLKKAVYAFADAPDETICFQARLNYYNWNENLLTRFFAIEYSALFDCMLPGLQSLRLPIPLGGTSNHIHLKKLQELRDWDPYNVTEDADLGLRLAMCGYNTQMLDSITLEEAPVSFMVWLRQRSRWIKGYMQTWLVYMRQPDLLRQQIGERGFWGIHLFIGSPCLVFLLSPFLWLFSGLWFAGVLNHTVSDWLMLLCYTVFIAGAICHLQYALLAIRTWRWPGMNYVVLLYPFYWFLHSLASLRALKQLIVRPHYWDKTPHAETCYTLRDIKASILSLTKESSQKA